MMIFQDCGLDQDVGSKVALWHMLGMIRSTDHLLTTGTIISVPAILYNMNLSRNYIFLNMFNDFNGIF